MPQRGGSEVRRLPTDKERIREARRELAAAARHLDAALELLEGRRRRDRDTLLAVENAHQAVRAAMHSTTS